MNVLAYLLYGNRREYQVELAFSVVSALRFMKDNTRDVTIAVLSDRADLGFDLPVEQIPISPQELSDWTQGGTYHHRAKVRALGKALQQLKAPTVLVDTDTYFTTHPAALFDRVSPSASVMNAFEYKLCDEPLWQPIVAQLGAGKDLAGVRVTPQSSMYNSGVVGLHPDNAHVLDQSLALLDALYALSPIFNIEQFALGAVLQAHTMLHTCEDVLKHYWGFERDFIHVQASRLLQGMTRATLPDVMAAFGHAALGYPRKRRRDQLHSRALGKLHKWTADYRFAHLAYLSALAYAPIDTGYANAWASAALAALQMQMKPSDGKDRPRRDFAKFSEPRIETLSWLDGAVKQKWLHFWRAA